MKLINPDAYVTLACPNDDLTFVFIGDEYAGSAEKGPLDVWRAFPLLRLPDYDGGCHSGMWSAVGDIVKTHALASLKAVLGS